MSLLGPVARISDVLPRNKWLKALLTIGFGLPLFVWLCLIGGSRVYVSSEIDPGLLFFFHRQVAEPLRAIGLPLNEPAVINMEIPTIWYLSADLLFLASSAGLMLTMIVAYFLCGVAALVLTIFVWHAPLLAAGLYMTFWVPLEFAISGVGWILLVSVKLFS